MTSNELSAELRDIKQFLREDTRTIIENEINSKEAAQLSKKNESNVVQLQRELVLLKAENTSTIRLIENLFAREARIIAILFEILE